MGLRRPICCVAFFLAILGLHAAALAQSPAASPSWQSFRGGDTQGVVDTGLLPTQWSTDGNVRWRRPITGDGASSPVSVGGNVFLTTAYSAERSSQIRLALDAVAWLLAGAVVGLGLVFIHDRTAGTSTFSVFLWLKYASFFATAAILCLLMLLGEQALDYRRCPIRAWLGSMLLAYLCLLLCSCRAGRSKLATAVITSMAITLAIAAVWFVPAADHIFRPGATASLIVLLTVAFPPLMVACGLATDSVLKRGSEGAERLAQVSVGAIAFVSIAYLCARIASAGTAPPPPSGNPTGILWYPTTLLIVSAFLAVTIAFPSVFTRRRTEVTTRISGGIARRWALIGGLATAMLSLMLGSVWLAIPHSFFLSYHFPELRIEPSISSLSLAAVGIGLATVISCRFRLGSLNTRPASAVFCLSAFALALLYTVNNTYLNKTMVYTRAIVCIDGQTGDTNWVCESLDGPEGQLHMINTPATPTAVVHGQSVVAWFGSGGLKCCETDGSLRWTNPDIRFESIYGAGSSPIVHGDTVVVSVGSPQSPYVVGVELETGVERWRFPLAQSHPSIHGNSRTPLVYDDTVVVWGFEGLYGIDIVDGRLLWQVSERGGGGDQVTSVTMSGTRLYCFAQDGAFAAEFRDADSTQSPEIVWTSNVRGVNCATPVVVNGLIFAVTDNGIGYCVDAESGAVVWRERLHGRFYSSVISDQTHVFFTNMSGQTTVISAARSYVEVARNEIGDDVLGTLTPFNDGLLIRTRNELLFVAGKPEPPTPRFTVSDRPQWLIPPK